MSGQTIRVAVIATLSLVAVPAAHLLPGLDGSFVESGFRNGLHIVGFAALACLAFELANGSIGRRVLLALGAVLLLGSAAEFSQRLFGGQFNPQDLAVDLLGGATGLMARVCWHYAAGLTGWSRLTSRLVSVALVISLFLPTVYWWRVLESYQARIPLVADFSVSRDWSMLMPVNAARQSDDNGMYPELILLDGRWSGVVISPVVSDWSNFESLTLNAALDGPGRLRLSVLLSDGEHPGFRTQHPLGRQDITSEDRVFRFPLQELPDDSGRPPLDIANVEKIYVIATFRGERARLVIERITLN